MCSSVLKREYVFHMVYLLHLFLSHCEKEKLLLFLKDGILVYNIEKDIGKQVERQ